MPNLWFPFTSTQEISTLLRPSWFVCLFYARKPSGGLIINNASKGIMLLICNVHDRRLSMAQLTLRRISRFSFSFISLRKKNRTDDRTVCIRSLMLAKKRHQEFGIILHADSSRSQTFIISLQ